MKTKIKSEYVVISAGIGLFSAGITQAIGFSHALYV